jgi:hypothetical protein
VGPIDLYVVSLTVLPGVDEPSSVLFCEDFVPPKFLLVFPLVFECD